MKLTLINTLEKKLRNPLPGVEAHKVLSPANHKDYLNIRDDHRIASVLLLLFPKNGEWHITYIQRPTNNPDDRHAGQISFPGGKMEDSDQSLQYCALRETHEEIGITPNKVEILGQLSDLYVHVSNFMVYPFVGFMKDNYEFNKQLSEVKEIIEVPLSYLTQKDILKKGSIHIRNMIINNVPYYDLYGKKLWGATAMMTSEFLHLLEYSESQPFNIN